jgi:hypothetical protein
MERVIEEKTLRPCLHDSWKTQFFISLIGFEVLSPLPSLIQFLHSKQNISISEVSPISFDVDN